nr:hypothetical protein [Tanacetum cinerariifolium]
CNNHLVIQGRRSYLQEQQVVSKPEFGDSYEAPQQESTTASASEGSVKKKGRNVTYTTDDMQKRRNDAAILKTFSRNEATKKTKKNLLKQQYGNFKAEGLETLEQTFNRLQAIIEEDDIEEMNIKWNMALPSMRADRFWKKPRKKISIQGTNVAGFDKSKDWRFMANEEENHALVADEESPTEFTLMAKSSSNNETGLPEFADDTITDYSRPSPAIKSNSDDFQNRKPSVAKTGASSSTILSKPAIKFVKSADRSTESKIDKVETAKKLAVKYAELYRKTSKSPNGNSQNNIDNKGYWDSGCSRTSRQHNMYLIDLNNVVPHKDLTGTVAKASADEWKFEAKGDEGYFIGYSMSSKAFR